MFKFFLLNLLICPSVIIPFVIFFLFWTIKIPSFFYFSKVAILLGSANRDPRIFENPDQINFKREMKDHSSWGGGIHFCIGTHLAKLELGVSFNHILEKQFSLIEEPSRTGAFGIRGFKNLLVSA